MRNKKKKKHLGNPLFTFRLPKERANILKEVSKLYGSPSASAFVRELIYAVCSSNLEELSVFMRKFQEKTAAGILEQMVAAPRPEPVLTAKEGKTRA